MAQAVLLAYKYKLLSLRDSCTMLLQLTEAKPRVDAQVLGTAVTLTVVAVNDLELVLRFRLVSS